LICCISKIYYMSLVKYIARLQWIRLHLIGTVADKQDDLASRMNLSREVIFVILQAEKGIHFGINQNWRSTYLTYDYTSTCVYLYKSIRGYSNHCWSKTFRCKCYFRNKVQLKQFKVFPIFRAADLLAWSAVR